jgi:type I restriction-modification system DNA methylase subunit
MKTNFQNPGQLEKSLTGIVDRIERRAVKISNSELLEFCGEASDFLSRDADPHFCHEIAEAAINLLIKEKYAEELFAANSPEFWATTLKTFAARLPTQTWRSRQQTIRQQFSTPPAIAYLLAYLLNLKSGEQSLEPSAGTGNLAVWANSSGLKTHTNQVDSRRRELLEVLGFQPSALTTPNLSMTFSLKTFARMW